MNTIETVDHTWDEAYDAAKSGKRISSPAWSAGVWAFYQVPSEVPEAIIPKMSSLPPDVKAEFIRRGGPIRYSDQFGLVHPDNSIVGWLPDHADFEAIDWVIYHESTPAEYTAAPVAETVGTAKPLSERIPGLPRTLEDRNGCS